MLIPASQLYLSEVLDGSYSSLLRTRHIAALARGTLEAFDTQSNKYWSFISPENVGFNQGSTEATLCTCMHRLSEPRVLSRHRKFR